MSYNENGITCYYFRVYLNKLLYDRVCTPVSRNGGIFKCMAFANEFNNMIHACIINYNLLLFYVHGVLTLTWKEDVEFCGKSIMLCGYLKLC